MGSVMIPSPSAHHLADVIAKAAHCPSPKATLALLGVAAYFVYRYGEHRYAAGYCDCARLRCSRRRR